MKLDVFRDAPLGDTMFGTLLLSGTYFCKTIEDQPREDPNPETPHNEAKVHGQTAIPAGTYELGLRDSPKFGDDALWVKGVPGYSYIMIHSGEDIDDTEGCLVVGDRIDPVLRKISGGKARGVLAKLRDLLVPLLKAGERIPITYHDADI